MKVQTVTYPVILHPNHGNYDVLIPDIDKGVWIRGAGATSALTAAHDVIGKLLAIAAELPRPTDSNQLELADGDVVHQVTVNLAEFRLHEPV